LPYPPLAPELEFPTNNQTDALLQTEYRWFESSGSNIYNIQISQTDDFVDPLIDSNIPTKSIILSEKLEYDTEYFWRVNATNEDGTSDWSEIAKFRTAKILTSPTLVSPKNNTFDLENEIKLTWNEVENSTTYQIQITDDPNFQEENLIDYESSENSLNLSDLEFGTNYFWRVRSVNQNGPSEWTNPWQFGIKEENIAVPMLIFPANTSADNSKIPTFNWSPTTEESATYYFQLNTIDDFDNSLMENLVLNENIIEDIELDYGEQYFWRVKLATKLGESDWSEVWSFSVESELEMPQVSYPVNEIDVPLEAEFKWKEINAGSYSLEISKYSNLSGNDNIVIVNIDGTLKSRKINQSLNPKTEYYWQLTAYSPSGEQVLKSDIHSFTTTEIKSIDFSEHQIVIYPNPVIDILSVNSEDLIRIELVDLKGSLLASSDTFNNLQLNLTGYKTGIYFLNIYKEYDFLGTYKLIKR
jgi:hypothetical protein